MADEQESDFIKSHGGLPRDPKTGKAIVTHRENKENGSFSNSAVTGDGTLVVAGVNENGVAYQMIGTGFGSMVDQIARDYIKKHHLVVKPAHDSDAPHADDKADTAHKADAEKAQGQDHAHQTVAHNGAPKQADEVTKELQLVLEHNAQQHGGHSANFQKHGDDGIAGKMTIAEGKKEGYINADGSINQEAVRRDFQKSFGGATVEHAEAAVHSPSHTPVKGPSSSEQQRT
jgi:hypothetical protein